MDHGSESKAKPAGALLRAPACRDRFVSSIHGHGSVSTMGNFIWQWGGWLMLVRDGELRSGTEDGRKPRGVVAALALTHS